MFRFIIFLFLISLTPSVVADFSRECQKRLPATKVTVKAEPVVYDVDLKKSIAQLTKMSHKGHTAHRTKTLGLAVAELNYNIDWGYKNLTDPRTQKECISPEINVTLSYTPMTVYVAKEFKKGSCEHREIWKHEMKHVNVYRKHLDDIKYTLAKELRQIFSKHHYEFDEIGLGKRYLTEAIHSFWGERTGEFVTAVHPKQENVDTAEEYARVARTCGGNWQINYQ